MRCRWFLLFLLIVTACGKNGHIEGHWPAKIVAIENFSATEKEELLQAISEANRQSGKNIIDSNSASESYPITIRLVDEDANNRLRAGFATMEEDKCTIELSRDLYDSDKHSYFNSVVWHEIGHCAGLRHDPKHGELMFATAAPFDNYSKDALTRFFAELRASAGF